jgi:hypothetical protein
LGSIIELLAELGGFGPELGVLEFEILDVLLLIHKVPNYL